MVLPAAPSVLKTLSSKPRMVTSVSLFYHLCLPLFHPIDDRARGEPEVRALALYVSCLKIFSIWTSFWFFFLLYKIEEVKKLLVFWHLLLTQCLSVWVACQTIIDTCQPNWNMIYSECWISECPRWFLFTQRGSTLAVHAEGRCEAVGTASQNKANCAGKQLWKEVSMESCMEVFDTEPVQPVWSTSCLVGCAFSWPQSGR